ncbi:MAG TPA: hypothetical protein VHT27_04000 [Solirubrobacteraceae bacterium]|nr:hypothetical protein [Solirubrobacteraceae bacterium]
MDRRGVGPRRSQSVDAYLRRTHALAAVALLVLAGAIFSDALAGSFWARHPLLAGLVASAIIVVLTVALLNEAIERRSRQRWAVLAQYVMLQLVRDTRMVWTGLAELAQLMASRPHSHASDALTAAVSIDAGAAAVRDTNRLTVALRQLVVDEHKRGRLHDEVTRCVRHNDEVLGRWAAVMLNADVYAELFDRHVELAGDLVWLASLLSFELSQDEERARPGRNHPAALI